MNKKRIAGLLMIAVMIFGSACFATDLVGNAVKDKAGELGDQLTTDAVQNLQATVESAAGISVEDVQLTSQAFANLSPEDLQATVNSAIGMDEEYVREAYYLPDDAMYITQLGDMINFQILWPMQDVIDYYRTKLASEGMTEREINTSITDITGNLVFTGHESGKLFIVQTVALNDQQTNVSIRLESE